MKFRFIYKSLFLLGLFFVTSCGKFADDINIDPNSPSKPSTAAMFTAVFRNLTGTANAGAGMAHARTSAS